LAISARFSGRGEAPLTSGHPRRSWRRRERFFHVSAISIEVETTMNTLWVIVGCGVLAIVYGIWATMSVLSADAGSAKMQEISAAVREGAQAYLSANTPPFRWLAW
jgi:hypothetical protein